jgi:hypothetical protein
MKTGMCSSLPCVEARWEKSYPLDQLSRDALGYSWCPLCTERGRLAGWAKQMRYPDVRAGLYAAGPGEEMWRVALTMGKDAMIETLRRAIWPDEGEAA